MVGAGVVEVDQPGLPEPGCRVDQHGLTALNSGHILGPNHHILDLSREPSSTMRCGGAGVRLQSGKEQMTSREYGVQAKQHLPGLEPALLDPSRLTQLEELVIDLMVPGQQLLAEGG